MSNQFTPVVIFRAQSDIEAAVVQGLLETHGIRSLLVSDVPHSVWPLTVGPIGEVRVSVSFEEAEKARQLVDDFQDELNAKLGRLRDEFSSLETALEYTFSDRGLLEHALTHRSRVHEDASGGVVDNESLEFLGDAVIGLIVADRLFREFPEYDEGRKSKAKALLVSASSLTKLGEKLGLGTYLLLGHGEEKSGGRRKSSLIADAFEAVVAAIYLDGGLLAAGSFIDRLFRPALKELRAGHQITGLAADYKSTLQERLQSRGRPGPEYYLAGTQGPDHEKIFEVEVRIQGDMVARAQGRTKKNAEQRAAAQALQQLAHDDNLQIVTSRQG